MCVLTSEATQPGRFRWIDAVEGTGKAGSTISPFLENGLQLSRNRFNKNGRACGWSSDQVQGDEPQEFDGAEHKGYLMHVSRFEVM